MSQEKKLILSTQKSIHKPIEIEIDGTTYPNNPLSHALFEEIKKHEDAANDGDLNALYKQVQILYSVPIKVLNKLDVRDVNSLIQYTMAQIFQPKTKTEKEKAEKNAPKPGQNKSVLSPVNSQAS